MPDEFDPYYLWLGIPPQERPANHYRLLGIQLFEENPSVIESAADRQMAHLRSVQAGKHGALSQRLLNEVAAAKVCLLRAAQKARYDQALRAKLETQGAPPPPVPRATAQVQPTVAAQVQPKTIARAQPLASRDPSASEDDGFWEDLAGIGGAPSAAKATKSHPRAAKSTRVKKFWPVLLVAGPCLLVVAVIVGTNAMSGRPEEPAPSQAVPAVAAPKQKQSLLEFDWPVADRSGLTLTVDGAKVLGPATGPWEYHCPPGPHHVVASRPGFKPIDKTIDAPIEGRRKIADAWQPLATLALEWPVEDRDGAVLTIDGELLATGVERPLIVPVTPGAHTVRITRLGFVPFEKNLTVAIDQRQDLPIALQPTAATLVIRWPINDRAGAELRIDGALHSTANQSSVDQFAVPVMPGTHTILITRPGFMPFSQTVTLGAASQKLIVPGWIAQPKPTTTSVANTQKTEADGEHTPSAVRHPIPSAPEQERIAKQLDGIYKPTHDAAKDLARAKELCSLASKAKELPERYMLLLKATDFALSGGDFPTALQAVDTLDTEFAIAPLDMKAKLLERFVKVASTADQISDAVGTAERLVDDAIVAERYDLATLLVASASKMLAKKGVDPDFRRDTDKALAGYRSQIKALEPQWEVAQKAKQTLATSPDDVDAAATLGRWYCFYKADWKIGLRLLAKSGNERLKAVAQLELQSPTDATQKAQLADQWWDVGQKEAGVVADSIRIHAGDLYRSAMPDLNSIVQKAAVEKRLAEVAEIRNRIAAASGQHSGPIVFQRGRWYDLLKLIDMNRDRVCGDWTRNGAELSAAPNNSNTARLLLPVVLEGGYDLEVDFTRIGQNNRIHTIFRVGPQICGFSLGASSYSGFDSIGGKSLESLRYYQFPYARNNIFLQNGHRYQQVFNVRLGKGGTASVDISIDGKQFLAHWEGDPTALGIETRYLPAPTQPALETVFVGSTTFNAVRLRMVSGQGHALALATDKPADQASQKSPQQSANINPAPTK